MPGSSDAASPSGSTTSSTAVDRAESAHGTANSVRTGAGAPIGTAVAAAPRTSDLGDVLHGSAGRLISGTGVVVAHTATTTTEASSATPADRAGDPVAHGAAGGITTVTVVDGR